MTIATPLPRINWKAFSCQDHAHSVPEVELQEGLCQRPSQYKDVQPGIKRKLLATLGVVNVLVGLC